MMGAQDGGTRRTRQSVRFGRFTFDERTHELFEEGRPVALQPKPTLVLAELIAARGALVERQRLYDAAWGDTVVEYDLALNRCIRDIRAALGDDARDPTFVATVPRRGYRLVAPVGPDHPAPAPRSARRRWQFAVAVVAVLATVSLVLRGPADGPDETILTFHSFGEEVVGIDRALQADLSRRLRLGTTAPKSSGLLVNGVVVPAPDGATLEVTLVSLSDGRTVWRGRYNPLCDRIVGDPIELIGTLISREVMARS